MTRRLRAKARPLDPEQLLPVRKRRCVHCPFCGHERKISWLTKLLTRDLHAFNCRSCEITFLIPMQLDFKPSKSIAISADSTRGINCKSCRVGFLASHCYEQCPACGQVYAVTMEPGAKPLRDNSSEFLAILERARESSEI